MTYYWGANEARVKWLSALLGTDVDARRDKFVSGSMFWARLKCLQDLTTLNFESGDFEAEAAQRDGTLAHAIERAVSLCAWNAGYRVVNTELADIRETPSSKSRFA